MSLPEPWVDRLFTKLVLVYGNDFLRRWDGLEIADVKADWAHELSAYQQSPGAIRYALENLPQKPPNVLEFRAICQRAPSTPVEHRLEYSETTEEGRQAGLQLARETLNRIRAGRGVS